MKNNYLFLLLLLGPLALFSQHKSKTRAVAPYQPVRYDLHINGQNPSAPTQSFFNPLPIPTPQALSAAPLTAWKVQAQSEEGVFMERTISSDSHTRNQLPPEQLAYAYLQEAAPVLQMTNPDQELTIRSIQTDDLGHTHIRLQQQYEGTPIYGAEGILHLTPERILLNGQLRPSPTEPALSPTLDSTQATQIALTDVAQHTAYRVLTPAEKEMLGYEGPVVELFWYQAPNQAQLRLTYVIEIRPNFLYHWKYFIDAQTGSILRAYNHTCSLGPTTATGQDLNGQTRTINVFEDANSFVLLDASKDMYKGSSSPTNGDGFIITADMNNTSPQNPSYNEITSSNNTWTPAAVSAHYNASLCYDYFRNTFNQMSINGSGGDILSFINVADENGGGMDNAFWNGAAMFYGNGSGLFTPLAGALDVAAHEMGHGVIQNSANLDYEGQSGALNESFADIFGVMVDRNDWALGEDVIPNNNTFPNGHLRNMANPHNGHPAGSNPLNSAGYQPRHMSEIYTGNQDNGGVHINSGIANYAFYQFVQAMGGNKSKAEQVYYRALQQYLTRSSKFVDCRLAVIQAAKDLYGANSAEAQAAATAFDAVGINAPTGGGGGSGGGGTTTVDPNPTIPVNAGADKVVYYSTSFFDLGTFYLTDGNGTGKQQLSTTAPRNRMSVADDGSVGYFVSQNNILRGLAMNPANPSEQNVANSPDWNNASLSKDGSKLALISRYQDTSIYVYDFNSDLLAKYPLYNPTTAQGGISSGGVLFADALEWDYSGEYLMYDAKNRIPNNNGPDREYWDVGFIRVWDNQLNTWGDGNISKLFSNLDVGQSVGNAVFSKNSTNIIAFDYIEATATDTLNYLLAGNIETGQIGTIYQNDRLSYPSYSRTDEKMIFNANYLGNPAIGIIDLATDKINAFPNAGAYVFKELAAWGVWYAAGQRPLSIATDLRQEIGLEVFPNPFDGQLTLRYELSDPTALRYEVQTLLGQTVYRVATLPQAPGLYQEQLELSQLPAGTYLLRVTTDQGMETLKVVKY